MIVMIVNSMLHILWCYLFITIAGLEVTGAGLAMSVTWFLNLTSLTLYVQLSKCCKESWICFDIEVFHDLREFLSYGVPSALEMLFEWGTFEMVTLLVGYVGVNELAGSAIAFSVLAIFYMVTYSVCSVTTALVGNSLGDNSKYNAIVYSRMSMFLSTILTAMNVVLTIVFRYEIAAIYTTNEELQEITAGILYLGGLMQIFDDMIATERGILRGIGLQKYAAIIFFVVYWVMMLPTSAVLVLVYDYGANMVWGMLIVGTGISFFTILTLIVFSDWDKLLISIQARLQETSKKGTSS